MMRLKRVIWATLALLGVLGWFFEGHAQEAQQEAQHDTQQHVQQKEAIITPPVAASSGEAATTSVTPREIVESPRKASHRILQEIMAGDEFHQKSTLRVPEFMRSFFAPQPGETPANTANLPWLKTLLSFLASFLEVLLWLTLAALLVYLAYRYRLWDFSGRPPVTREQSRPETLMGLDVSVDALPQDTLAAVREAWHQGQTRQAISLLYRSALIHLMDECDCQFYEGDTEALCLEEARRKAAPQTSTYFERLTRSWQGLAYGHQTLDAAQFDRLVGEWNLAWQKPDHD